MHTAARRHHLGPGIPRDPHRRGGRRASCRAACTCCWPPTAAPASGFLLALTGLFGWIDDHGLIWSIYGIGMKGPTRSGWSRRSTTATSRSPRSAVAGTSPSRQLPTASRPRQAPRARQQFPCRGREASRLGDLLGVSPSSRTSSAGCRRLDAARERPTRRPARRGTASSYWSTRASSPTGRLRRAGRVSYGGKGGQPTDNLIQSGAFKHEGSSPGPRATRPTTPWCRSSRSCRR